MICFDCDATSQHFARAVEISRCFRRPLDAPMRCSCIGRFGMGSAPPRARLRTQTYISDPWPTRLEMADRTGELAPLRSPEFARMTDAAAIGSPGKCECKIQSTYNPLRSLYKHSIWTKCVTQVAQQSIQLLSLQCAVAFSWS